MKQFITLMLLACITGSAFAQSALSVNPFPKTISVNGTAEIELTPDEIYVAVTLKEYEKKGAGKVELEKIKAEFLAACKSIGLPDSVITIASYEGVNPKLLLNKKKSKEQLYATIGYQIKFSNSKKIDELVNKLNDEATQNFEIARVAHSKIIQYRRQARIEAIQAAKEKARYLTEAVGEKLGEAVTITENQFNEIGYMTENARFTAQYMANIAKDGDADAGVDFKKIKISVQINVQFAIK